MTKDKSASPTVFLSYAREDLVLAQRLALRIQALGHSVAMDVTDISAGEDWKKRLEALLQGAAKVVFFCTAASASSVACAEELALARTEGKQILPVLQEGTSRDLLPPDLRRLHYTRLSDTDDWAAGIAMLDASIRTDLGWERQKTYYLLQAQRKGALLHTVAELRGAEAWALARPRDAAPVPEQIRRLIADSRARQSRKNRSLLLGLCLAIAAFAGIAAIAWRESIRANLALAESMRREAMLSIDPALELSLNGWTFEAVARLKAILAMFPDGALPESLLMPAEAILQRAEAETPVPVPRDATIIPGRDGVWVVAVHGGDQAVALLRPDGTRVDFTIAFPAPVVAVADYADGPRAILSDATTVGLDLSAPDRLAGAPEPLPPSIAVPNCSLHEGKLIFPGTCTGASPAVTAFLNLRGEFALVTSYSTVFPAFGIAACLADDGSLGDLIDPKPRVQFFDDAEYVACRADPDHGWAIGGFWTLPGSSGNRSNFDLLFVQHRARPDDVACLDLGYWQDVDVAVLTEHSAGLYLTDGNKVRITHQELAYGSGVYPVDCVDVDLSAWSDPEEAEREILLPASIRFARLYRLDLRPEADLVEILMVYMPDRAEVRLLTLSDPEPEAPLARLDIEVGDGVVASQLARDKTGCAYGTDDDAPFDLNLGAFQIEVEPHEDDARITAKLPDGATFDPFGLWDKPTLEFHEGVCLALSSDRGFLAAVDIAGLRVFDLRSGEPNQIAFEAGSNFKTVVFQSETELLVGTTTSVERWSADTTGVWQTRTVMTSSTPIWGLALSPSGQRLAITRDDAGGTVTGIVVLSLTDDRVIAEFPASTYAHPKQTVGFDGEDRLYIQTMDGGEYGGHQLPSEAAIRERAAVLP